MMSYDDLRNSTQYIYHHTATRRGYVSRRQRPVVEEYCGKFGSGYVVRVPRYDTTQYHTVEYYIKED